MKKSILYCDRCGGVIGEVGDMPYNDDTFTNSHWSFEYDRVYNGVDNDSICFDFDLCSKCWVLLCKKLFSEIDKIKLKNYIENFLKVSLHEE